MKIEGQLPIKPTEKIQPIQEKPADLPAEGLELIEEEMSEAGLVKDPYKEAARLAAIEAARKRIAESGS